MNRFDRACGGCDHLFAEFDVYGKRALFTLRSGKNLSVPGGLPVVFCVLCVMNLVLCAAGECCV